MDEQTHQQHSKILHALKTVVRVVCGIVGAALIVIGAVLISVASHASLEQKLSTGIMGFYCIVFGVLIVIAESRTTKTKKMMKFFKFLSTYIGRGLFYVFVGIVVYPITYPSHVIGIIAGILLVVGGVLNLLLFPCFCKMDRKLKKEKEDQKLQQQQQQQKLQEMNTIEKSNNEDNYRHEENYNKDYDNSYKPNYYQPNYQPSANPSSNPFETGGGAVVV